MLLTVTGRSGPAAEPGRANGHEWPLPRGLTGCCDKSVYRDLRLQPGLSREHRDGLSSTLVTVRVKFVRWVRDRLGPLSLPR